MTKPTNVIEAHAVVAVILAVGIAVAVILLTVETILHSGTVTEQEASLLSSVLGAVVGAIATYMGFSKGNGKEATDLDGAPETSERVSE